jgi:hypothetical protein
MDTAFRIGWATVDITPDRPVQLMGQYYERISQGVRDPISATALALESGSEQAVIVSCDLVAISEALQERVRALVAPRLPDLDPGKLILAATHIHTGPVLEDGGWYPIPPPGVMTGAEYREFLAARLADVVQQAWNARKPGGVSWALGRAVVGHNRRVAYDDGTVQMYGNTDTPHFVGMEGGEDHGVEMLFTWDATGELTGVAINVACPAQVVEHLYVISADYWSEVRKQLRTRRCSERQDVLSSSHASFDKLRTGSTDMPDLPDLFVLPLCAAAGDQSPRDLVRSHQRAEADILQHGGETPASSEHRAPAGQTEPNMWSEEGLAEIGKRLASVVESALPAASATIQKEPVFKHVTTPLDLPARKVTDQEAEAARPKYEELARQQLHQGSPDFGLLRQLEGLLRRYDQQQESVPLYRMQLHVLRLGEIALATNPFELYLDYALRIKARSKALQTFVVQLCGHGGYLPTARAVLGGGYSARAEDNEVGPEGGQALVERTVEIINRMWEDT